MAVNPETTTRKLIAMPHDLVRRVNDWRHVNRIGSEAEAIRRLIEIGLKAAAEAKEPARDAG